MVNSFVNHQGQPILTIPGFRCRTFQGYAISLFQNAEMGHLLTERAKRGWQLPGTHEFVARRRLSETALRLSWPNPRSTQFPALARGGQPAARSSLP